MDREGLKLIYPSLAGCRSIGDIQRIVGRRAAATRSASGSSRCRWGDRPSTSTRERARREALAHPGGPRRRGAGSSRVHPRDLGLLEQAAGLLDRQRVGPPRVRHHARHRRRRRGDPEGRRGRAHRRLRGAQPHPGARVHLAARGAPVHPCRPAPRAGRVPAALCRPRRDRHIRGPRHRARGAGRLPRGTRAGAAPAPRLARGEPDLGGVRGAGRIRDLASWAGGRGLGDDRLRVGGIYLDCGGDAEVARILHASQPYTGWAGFVESAKGRTRTGSSASWPRPTGCA